MNAPVPRWVLAFDLGGTRLKAGVVNCAQDRIDLFEIAASDADADVALATLARVGTGLLARRACDRAALCIPGLVEDDGHVRALPGKLEGIVGRNLRNWLQRHFALEALVVNDAIAFGVGEASAGAARDFERAVVVTLGTGVGVSVNERGRPISRGILGGGLLGGQIPIADDPAGPLDTNGKHGTIEALCRADSIVARVGTAGGNCHSVAEVYEAYAAGDTAARHGLSRYRRDLARALVALAHAHAPDVIVLGGGPMVPDNPVLPGLQDLVNADLWPGFTTEIVVAALGDEAALIGLARLVLQSDAETTGSTP